MAIHQLTDKSYLEIYEDIIECNKEDFNEFWELHPTERHKIMMYGRLVECPRWQALYGSGSYKFSGTVMKGTPTIPFFVEKCFEVARKLYPDNIWNGALVNWYPNGSSYIGPHSDDEKDLVPGSPILSFSFGQVRTFRIIKKKPASDGEISKIDLDTGHCSLIAMCGDMQKEYTHQITKTAKKIGPRINVTIRCFK